LKCGSGEGWRKSVGWIRRQIRKLYIRFRTLETHYTQYGVNTNGWVMCHDGLLCDILEGRMLGRRTRGRRIQLIDNLLEKIITHWKKAAEDRNDWRTVRRDSHSQSSSMSR